jgi:hypothetical protein
MGAIIFCEASLTSTIERFLDLMTSSTDLMVSLLISN